MDLKVQPKPMRYLSASWHSKGLIIQFRYRPWTPSSGARTAWEDRYGGGRGVGGHPELA